jgi:hypothetical protein
VLCHRFGLHDTTSIKLSTSMTGLVPVAMNSVIAGPAQSAADGLVDQGRALARAVLRLEPRLPRWRPALECVNLGY